MTRFSSILGNYRTAVEQEHFNFASFYSLNQVVSSIKTCIMRTMETDFLSIKGNEVVEELIFISRVSCSSMFSV